MQVRALSAASIFIVIAVAMAACSSTTKSDSTAATATSSGGSPASANAPASTSTAAAAGGGAVNACSLLTAAQASSIVGVTYTAASPAFAGKVCTYASTAAPVPMTVTLLVNSGGAAAWTEELATLKLDGATPVTLSGLGDRASETTGSLATQSGNWIVQVDGGDATSVNGGNIGGDFTKSIAVARAILAAQH